MRVLNQGSSSSIQIKRRENISGQLKPDLKLKEGDNYAE
jgi:hypothetical protein